MFMSMGISVVLIKVVVNRFTADWTEGRLVMLVAGWCALSSLCNMGHWIWAPPVLDAAFEKQEEIAKEKVEEEDESEPLLGGDL